MLTLTAGSPEEQEAVGARLAAALEGGAVVWLQGDLGAGKTTLVRGLLRALGHEGAVKSPTYTLLEPYEVAGREVFHLDLYRLSDPGELEYLGVRDLSDGAALLLVEWPERGRGELPEADLLLSIDHLERGRVLHFEPRSARGRRVLAGMNP